MRTHISNKLVANLPHFKTNNWGDRETMCRCARVTGSVFRSDFGGWPVFEDMTFAHFDIVVKPAITKVLWNLTLRSHCIYWTGNSVYRTLVWKGRIFCPVPCFVALVGIGGKFDTASVSLGLWQCHVRHKHVPFPVKPFLNCNDSCGTSAKKLAAIQFEGRPEEFHSYPTSTWPPSACS